MITTNVKGARSITWRDFVAGVYGHVQSSMLLAWLASHRGRLRTVLIGGSRLSVLVIWDDKAATTVRRTRQDEDAIYQIVYGDEPSSSR